MIRIKKKWNRNNETFCFFKYREKNFVGTIFHEFFFFLFSNFFYCRLSSFKIARLKNVMDMQCSRAVVSSALIHLKDPITFSKIFSKMSFCSFLAQFSTFNRVLIGTTGQGYHTLCFNFEKFWDFGSLAVWHSYISKQSS